MTTWMISNNAKKERKVVLVLLNHNLVGQNLVHGLPLSNHLKLTRTRFHHLWRFREGVVVLTAHAGAVRSRTFDDDQIADVDFSQFAFAYRFRLIRGRGHQVATFAAVTDDDVFFRFGCKFTLAGDVD